MYLDRVDEYEEVEVGLEELGMGLGASEVESLKGVGRVPGSAGPLGGRGFFRRE